MLITRKDTRRIYVGGLSLGGGAPVRVQSMTKTDTRDVKATLYQIKSLSSVGCEIVRLAVPDMEAARKIREIKKRSPIPIVADIHFDWRLALESIRSGADKIRINPGNFPSENLKSVIKEAKSAGIPVRIGVNIGSLKSAQNESTSEKKAEALALTALRWCRRIEEDFDFGDIVVSIKASDVPTTIEAYRRFAQSKKNANYPLHIGITEAGPRGRGSIKSAAGLGALLYLGLGDTVRVSLTAEPEREVEEAYLILQAMGLRTSDGGFDIISCPTCGRCSMSEKMPQAVHALESQLEKIFSSKKYPRQTSAAGKNQKILKIALMGCAVNGPGEARDADIGIAFAGEGDKGVLFKDGKPTGRKFPFSQVTKALCDEVLKIIKEG